MIDKHAPININRGKIVEETTECYIKTYNPAFALLELQGIDGDIVVSDEVHTYLYNLEEKSSGPYEVKLELTNDYCLENGPNHCGIICVYIRKKEKKIEKESWMEKFFGRTIKKEKYK